MHKLFTFLVLTSGISILSAQLPAWNPIGTTGFTSGGSGDLVISDANHVYIGGSLAFIDNVACNDVARFNGTVVEDVATQLGGINVTTAMVFWNNTLVIGVYNTNGTHRIYKLNGTNWEAIGGSFNGHINCLEVYNNELYAGGQFTNYNDTVQMRRLCKWNGSAFVELGQTGLQIGMVYDLEVYNNELVIGMDNMVLNGYRNIARYDGSSLSIFPVTFDYQVEALKTIGNKLYIGGGFLEEYTSGMDLNKVAVWDGSVLSAMGTGVTGSGGVDDFVEYNGNVIAVGGFSQIGSVTTNFAASWDGSAWSKISDENMYGFGALKTATVYNNKLFVAGGSTVGVSGKGHSVFYLEQVASVENNNTIKANVYPNPTSEIVTIETENMKKITILDALGKMVNEVTLSENLSRYSMDLEDLKAGLYFVHVTTPNGTCCTKIIKQ